MENIVGICQTSLNGYPVDPPYHPPSGLPELRQFAESDSENPVFSAVRELFILMGFDREHYGNGQWNPLGWLVKPGDTVFLKPNMIAHKHLYSDEWQSVVTHGSVLRAVIDYIFIALSGRGRLVVGDAPQTDSNFDEIIGRMGLRQIQSYYQSKHSFSIEVFDLRDEHWVERGGILHQTEALPGDPLGSTEVDLAHLSMFGEVEGEGRRYYGAFYDSSETNQHHCCGKHEYSISKTPLLADVFINLPKLKTHKKCGLTVNLKSLVGINANKNWLPHYAYGFPQSGGDQFPKETRKARLENVLVRNAKRALLRRNPIVQFVARMSKTKAYSIFGDNDTVVRSGNWFGNDTVWRMCLDLNRILMYCNPDGTFRPTTAPKRFFSIVDGIVCMEGDGPVAGKRKEVGVLVAGKNAVAVDAVCASLMAFDYAKIPLIHRAMDRHPYPLFSGRYEDIATVSNAAQWNKTLNKWKYDDSIPFEPHFGWKNHIEVEQ